MSVVRDRLLRLLADPPATDVVIVVAPPGYGKTVLLQHFAQIVPVAYVSLAQTTSYAGFVRELISAVAPQSLALTGSLFGERAEREEDSVVSRWVLERLSAVATTIVLDDLHGIAEDPRCMRLLATLIAGTHARIRWILASRVTPLLPISTWLARSVTSLPLTERDLSFSREDAQEAARIAGASIGDADLDALRERNAGWPMGMQLALEAWNRVGDVRALFAENRQRLFAHLHVELWNHLSALQREVITACALVTSLSEDVLREAGYTDAGLALTAIERRVPLVTRLPDGGYGLHEFFREFVLEQMASDSALLERVIDVLGPALERSGREADVLGLARRTGRPENIVAALDHGGLRLIDGGAREMLEETLAVLPASLRRNGVVRAIRGAIAQSTGRRDEAEGDFLAALRTADLSLSLRGDIVIRIAALRMSRLDADGGIALLVPLAHDPAVPADRRLQMLGLLAVCLAIAGRDDEARSIAGESQDRLARAGTGVPASMHRFLALTYFYLDHFDRARRHAVDALAAAREIGDDRTVMSAYSVLLAIAESDDLDAEPSRVYAREIVLAGVRLGDRGVQRHGLSCQLMIAARAGEGDEVRRLTAALETLGGAPVYHEFGCEVDLAVFYASDGDFDRARARLRGNDGRLSEAERLYRDSIVALIDIASGRSAGVLPRVSAEHASAASANIIERRYRDDARYCLALAHWAHDRHAQAVRALPRGDALGRRGKLILDVVSAIVRLPHPVPNEGPVEELCNGLGPHGLGAIGRLFLRVATKDKANVQLSPAEIALLNAFATSGGRTADVARALNKSPHTVRNQMRSVFAKIGCSGRNEAIAYARQRGWLTE